MSDAIDRATRRGLVSLSMGGANEPTPSDEMTEAAIEKKPRKPKPVADARYDYDDTIATGMLRISERLNNEMRSHAVTEKASRDTLVEAFWIWCKRNPKALQEISAIARDRRKKRRALQKVLNAKKVLGLEED